MTNCLFIGNAAGIGGGIGNYTPTQNVTVTNCTFSGNSAVGDGGGVHFQNDGINSKLDNCVFWGNSDCGGMDESAQISFQGTPPAAFVVTYSDIMDDDPDDPNIPFGGEANGNIDDNPVFLEDPVQPSGSWTIKATYDPATDQTTFTDANATWTAGALVGQFLNPDTAQFLQSLIVSNTPTDIVVWADFSALGLPGKNYKVFDYHLDSASSSPCIDAADNNALTICTADLDGNERFFDDLATDDTGLGSPEHPFDFVDMGAYEFGGDPELDCNGNSIPDSCCPADLDGDEIVNAFDLAQLLGSWGLCPVPCPSDCSCPADFDADCTVGASDLAQLLGDWEPCQ